MSQPKTTFSGIEEIGRALGHPDAADAAEAIDPPPARQAARDVRVTIHLAKVLSSPEEAGR